MTTNKENLKENLKEKLALYMRKIEHYGNKLVDEKSHHDVSQKTMISNEIKEKLALYKRKIEHYGGKIHNGGANKAIVPNEVNDKLDLYRRKLEHYQQMMTNENVIGSKEQDGGSESGVKFIIFNDENFSDLKLENQKRDNFLSSSELAKYIGEDSYIIDKGSKKLRLFRGNRQAMISKLSKLILPNKKKSVMNLKDNIDINVQFNEASINNENSYKELFNYIRSNKNNFFDLSYRSTLNRFMVVSFGSGPCRNTLLYLSDVIQK